MSCFYTTKRVGGMLRRLPGGEGAHPLGRGNVEGRRWPALLRGHCNAQILVEKAFLEFSPDGNVCHNRGRRRAGGFRPLRAGEQDPPGGRHSLDGSSADLDLKEAGHGGTEGPAVLKGIPFDKGANTSEALSRWSRTMIDLSVAKEHLRVRHSQDDQYISFDHGCGGGSQRSDQTDLAGSGDPLPDPSETPSA